MDWRFSPFPRVSSCLALALLLSSCGSPRPIPPAPPPPVAAGVPVQGCSPNGSLLILADGSRWFIQPAGRGASLRWRPGTPVAVSRSGHAAWPWLLFGGGAAALARSAGPG